MRKPSSACTASKITPCCSKVGIKRGPWTPEEDEILANFVRREGEGQWRTLPKRAGLLRCGKSCRLRWMNYLRPSVKRGRIAPDEEDLILRLHRLLGNRWSLIAGRIPGRTDNEIKNYWNTHLSKKLINQGIDPRTHKPLNPNFNSSEAVANGSTTGNYTAVAYSNPKPNPKPDSISNPNNHNSSGSKETNPDDRSQDRFQNLVADRGSKNNNIIGDGFVSKNMGLESCSHGNGNDNNIENYTTNEMEDTFSSFLDSLINDDNGGRFENDQEQVVQPNVVAPFLHELPPAAPSFNISQGWDYGGLWGAELRYAMDTLGDEDHQKQSNVYNNTYNCNFWS